MPDIHADEPQPRKPDGPCSATARAPARSADGSRAGIGDVGRRYEGELVLAEEPIELRV